MIVASMAALICSLQSLKAALVGLSKLSNFPEPRRNSSRRGSAADCILLGGKMGDVNPLLNNHWLNQQPEEISHEHKLPNYIIDPLLAPSLRSPILGQTLKRKNSN